MKRKIKWIVLPASLVLIFTLLVLFEDYFQFQEIKTFIQSFGMAAPLIYILIYAISMVCLVPGTPYTIFAGFLFGPLLGAVYSVLGAGTGALIAFCIGRYFGADWVARYVAQSGNLFSRVVKGVNAKGWKIVAFLRIVPFFPFPWLNYALGCTQIRLRDYYLATIIFMSPATFAYAYLGSLGSGLSQQDTQSLVIKIGLVLSLLGLLCLIPWLIRVLGKDNKVLRDLELED